MSVKFFWYSKGNSIKVECLFRKAGKQYLYFPRESILTRYEVLPWEK